MAFSAFGGALNERFLPLYTFIINERVAEGDDVLQVRITTGSCATICCGNGR